MMMHLTLHFATIIMSLLLLLLLLLFSMRKYCDTDHGPLDDHTQLKLPRLVATSCCSIFSKIPQTRDVSKQGEMGYCASLIAS